MRLPDMVRPKYIGAAVLVAVSYYLGARVAFYVGTLSYLFAPLWPPNIILLCALLLAPYRAWALYIIVALPAHIAAETEMGMPASEWAGAFVSNCAFATIAAVGLRLTIKQPPWFGTLTKASTCMLIVALGAPAAVALAITVSARLSNETIGTEEFARNWFLANLSGGLTLAPLLLTWIGERLGWLRAPWHRWAEAIAVLTGLIVSGYFAFVLDHDRWQFPAYASLFIPLVLWATVRFGAQGAGGAIFIVTLSAIYGAMQGHGPFIAASPAHIVRGLQMFFALMSVPFIILAAVIEERQRALAEVRLSEKKLQLILDNTPASIYAKDLSGRYILANRAARLAAKLPPDFIGKTLHQISPDVFAPECSISDHMALHSNHPITREERIPAPGGTRFYLTTKFALRDADSRPSAVYGISSDITEHKLSMQALEASEAQFRVMAETVPAILFTADRAGRWEYANSRFFEFTGLPSDSTTRAVWSEHIHPEDQERVGRAWRYAISKGEPFFQELRMRAADGAYYWLLARGRPILDREGRIERWFGAAVQIDEVKRVEQELHRTNTRLTGILASISDFYYTLDNGLRITAMNPQAAAFAGVELSQVLGKNIFDVFRELAGTTLETAFCEALAEQKTVRLELPANKRLRQWLDISVHPLDAGVSVFTRDVSERKRAEEALNELSGRVLQSQDDERRRIARELHDSTAQNLAALQLLLQRLSRSEKPAGTESQQLFEESMVLVEQTLTELRTISYLLHPPLLDEIGLLPALRWYAQGFTRRSGIKVRIRMSAEVGRLASDIETALFRIVQESLGNVHRHSGSKTAAIKLGRRADEVVLIISDKGKGLPEGVAAKPQDDMRSLGVGIAGMGARLRQLGGRLEVESSKRGTTVRAIVPVEERPSGAST